MERRFHPLAEFSKIDEIIEKTIERTFKDLFPFRWRKAEAEEIIPLCDLIDKGKNLLLKVEVPGLEKEDIDISVDENSITIKGEFKKEKEEEGATYHRSERRYGSFSRYIELPQEIEPTKVDASLKNGVLEIILPKKKITETKKVEIKIK